MDIDKKWHNPEGGHILFASDIIKRIIQGDKRRTLVIFKGAKKGRISSEIAKAAEDLPCYTATTDNGWQIGIPCVPFNIYFSCSK